eukprot:scaffold34556_cov129-Isochrysis_galbana.AAC.3
MMMRPWEAMAVVKAMGCGMCASREGSSLDATAAPSVGGPRYRKGATEDGWGRIERLGRWEEQDGLAPAQLRQEVGEGIVVARRDAAPVPSPQLAGFERQRAGGFARALQPRPADAREIGVQIRRGWRPATRAVDLPLEILHRLIIPDRYTSTRQGARGARAWSA